MAFQVTEVQKVLAGVEYPATPGARAGQAAGNGASDDLVTALRGIDGATLERSGALILAAPS